MTGTIMNPSTTPPIPERPINGTFKDGVLSVGSIRGTLDGDTMTGTMQSRTGQGVTFKATRTK